MSELDERIVAVLMALGEGEVVAYGDVAHVAGFPGRARAVGSLLAGAAPDPEVPWWRVVRSNGRIATDPSAGQAALLRAEGVTVRAGRVVDAPIGRFRSRSGSARSQAARLTSRARTAASQRRSPT